ncbi:hypothetical protein LTR08_003365 [Meristemomyces frigidus]|nr:hypothetical protein LTR08_003365 [Meristemomyces frigidus]
MTTSQWPSTRVVPAQLAFLAIYNPSLGPTDETFADQCVFWYSRAAQEARAAAKKTKRSDAAGGDAAREEENEKLRQIGLAQGMVDFARSFSDGEAVDSIETERSRIVLQELEQGWWILASIDLTRLPSIAPTPPETTKKGGEKVEPKPAVEYSSREVSPPALLTQQLLQAHHVFLLHHGPSLRELFTRLSRDKFCNAIDRFWARFCKTWHVMLHGNPAADVFTGLKVASGGELGFGVGEEEWGSGEREVLEDLAHRTEGLVDLVVSRFGEPAAAIASDDSALPENEALPWMGSGRQPIASDGIVFGGIGAIARPSLRNVSLWMRQIYTYGEYAYGVRDNPSRERRKRRRYSPPEPPKSMNDSSRSSQLNSLSALRHDGRQLDGRTMDSNEGSRPPADGRLQMDGRTASHDHAYSGAKHAPPPHILDRSGIPAPIVSAAERALEKATQRAEEDAAQVATKETETDGARTTMGIPDQYMKYLTLGLSEIGRSSKATKRPAMPKRTSTGGSSQTLKALTRSNHTPTTLRTSEAFKDMDDDASTLTHVEPMPDGEALKAKIAMQRRQENKGYFVIGLTGDLDTITSEEAGGNEAEGMAEDDSRTVLRTLQVELPPRERDRDDSDNEGISEILTRRNRQTGSDIQREKEASMSDVRRLRVVVYVHRPFMYCFLFENRATSLSYAEFYRELHRGLVPIHKPLLSSTSVVKVAQRIESSHVEEQDAVSVRSTGTNRLPTKGGSGANGMRPIFDLIYDPRLLTVHTSIPNIPDPGTPAAEGFGAIGSRGAGWTRVDALNVHSQVLATLQSVKGRGEVERTSKTSRGWWIVWMRVPPSAQKSDQDDSKSSEGVYADLDIDSAATLHYNGGKNCSGSGDLASSRGGEQDAVRMPSTPTPSAHYFAHNKQDQQEAEKGDMRRMAFLVRQSSDGSAAAVKASASSRTSSAGGMWSSLGWGSSAATEEKAGGASAGWGPVARGNGAGGALAGGVGIDARRYVEGLLSLNR